MASTKRYKILKRLQTEQPRGAPFDHRDLARLGISSALAHHYLESGWLLRLGRGVFMFPNDTLQEDRCLKFLAGRCRGFHVGGKTALAWRGLRHNLGQREPLWLYGDENLRLPAWFTQRFPARFTTRTPFTQSKPPNSGLQPLPEHPNGVLVSVPERAIFELLDEVGVHQGIEEARHILEGVRHLRADVLAKLLRRCRRIKVLRLCVSWAEEFDLPWSPAVRKAAGRKLGRSRWTNRLKDGTLLTLRP